MEYKSDIEIAQSAKMLPIKEIAAKIGLSEDEIEYYGKYKAKVDNNVIHVLPAKSKLVKLFYEGDVRSRDLSEQDTHDQSIDSQVQVKLGFVVICDNLNGRYEIV